MTGLCSDEVGLRGEVESGKDAVVFSAPASGDGGQVELLGGGEDGEWERVRASGTGDDTLLRIRPPPHN